MRDVVKKTILLFFVLMGIAGFAEASSGIAVIVNGEELLKASELTKVIDQSVYVPIRTIAESLGAKVEWVPEDDTVEVKNGDQFVRLWIGQDLADVNGTMITLEKAAFAEAGRTYVPIRFLSESLGMNVDWVQATRTVKIASAEEIKQIEPVNKAVINYSDEDKKWLAKIIEAEAGGEPLEGKIAVGAVIINRVQAEQFPSTITNVVFDKANGYYQFSPVQNKTIYSIVPGKDTYEAVERALIGEDPSEGALYFYNPKSSSSKWIASRKVIKDIGSHRFAF